MKRLLRPGNFAFLIGIAWLVLALATTAIAAWPPAANPQKVVFIGDGAQDSTSQELYIMSPDGSSLKRLTNNSAIEQAPVLANDGRTVVFVSNRDGDDELYKINIGDFPAEDLALKLTSNTVGDRFPSVGPDGTVYYASGDASDSSTWEIYSLPLTGPGIVAPTKLTSNTDFDYMPAVSRDGQTIAFAANRPDHSGVGSARWEIYLMDADGSDERRFTNNDERDRNPAFSPDGATLAWDRMPTAGSGLLQAMDISDSTHTSSTVFDLASYDTSRMEAWISFAPTGDRLIFASNRADGFPYDGLTPTATDFELYEATIATSPPAISGMTTVTANPSWSHQADWGSIAGDITPPTTPTLVGFPIGTTTISLFWSPAADTETVISSYKIYNADTSSLVATTTATSHSFSVPEPTASYGYYVRAVNDAGNHSGASNKVTLSPGGGGDTSVGPGITISPTDKLSITFGNVTVPGTTTVATSSAGPPPPTGFAIGVPGGPPVYYDISTDASYTGPVIVAINYDDPPGPESVEDTLELLHYGPSSPPPDDITLYIDKTNNIIFGEVSSFSVFALAYPAPPSTGINHQIVLGLALGLTVFGCLLVKKRRWRNPAPC